MAENEWSKLVWDHLLVVSLERITLLYRGADDPIDELGFLS